MKPKRKAKSNSITDAIPKRKRILAIDPGTKVLGYADFSGNNLLDYGLKIFGFKSNIKDLINQIASDIERMILEKQPDLIILEKNRFSQITNNVRLMMVIYRIKSLARYYQIKIIEYSPNTIRAIICNNGYATKADLAKVIICHYPGLKIFIRKQPLSALHVFFNITDAVACGKAYLTLESKTYEK